MNEICPQPASMLDLIAKAAVGAGEAPERYTSLTAEMYPGVSNCLERRTSRTSHTSVKNRGGVGQVRPEADAGNDFALPKDATDYPLLPQDQAGRSRFVAAVTNLVNGICDAYGCDDCPGNERAELHRQAAEGMEAIKCFVLLARQAGLAIGRHQCWEEWGLAADTFTLPYIHGSSQATPSTGNSNLAISDVGGRQTW